MSRVWFDQPLDTVATFWRVMRRDGVTLGFTTHDRDLWFDGILHMANPGMVPSAIRRSADLEPDSAEVHGAFSHAAIAPEDLALGRFDGAQIMFGLVDWETLECAVLYRGAIGRVTLQSGKFTASLLSRKAELERDSVPRTSPTCRAEFCGPGCTLSAHRFEHEATLTASDAQANHITVATTVDLPLLNGGRLRWLDGPLAGLTMGVLLVDGTTMTLADPLDAAPPPGTRVLLREGCDRRLETCATRFANAINFQGEPFLPGNDLVTRYPSPQV